MGVYTDAAGRQYICDHELPTAMPVDVLAAGSLAYLDTYAGLLPCKILAVSRDSFYPSSNVAVTVRLTSNTSGQYGPIYRRGEIMLESSLHVVHRKHVHRHKYSTTLGASYGFRKS